MTEEHLNTEAPEKRIFSTLQRYCSLSERCRTDVEKKLQKLKVERNDFDHFIKKLEDENFIDQQRYADSFIRGHLRINWGKKKIKLALMQKKIDRPVIEQLLSKEDEGEYAGRIEFLAARKWTQLKEENRMQRIKKTTDFLLRKGFEYEPVNEAIRKLTKNKN